MSPLLGSTIFTLALYTIMAVSWLLLFIRIIKKMKDDKRDGKK